MAPSEPKNDAPRRSSRVRSRVPRRGLLTPVLLIVATIAAVLVAHQPNAQ